MPAVQDCIKVIQDLQVVVCDVVKIAKDDNLIDRLSGIMKAVSDAAPLAADAMVFAPEAQDLKNISINEAHQLSQAALALVFAVAAQIAK